MKKVILLIFSVLLCVPSAFAQADLVGDWEHPLPGEDAMDKGGGPATGDFLGLPLNDAGLFRAEAFSESSLTIPEHQCAPHPAPYQYWGPNEVRLTISKEFDPVTRRLVAIHMDGTYGLDRVVWMDGRPRPTAEAMHTFTGFSTGHYEGDNLVVETTHMKLTWIKRNGAPLSDRARMIEYFIRHDNYFTYVEIIDDPVYLSQPFIRSSEWVSVPRPPLILGRFGNQGDERVFYKCFPAEELSNDRYRVPHFLPGTNQLMKEFSELNQVPMWGLRAGAETLYPEFIDQLKQGHPGGMPAEGVAARRAADQSRETENSGVHSFHVKDQVWLVSDNRTNVTVNVGDEGVMVVDTGREDMAEAIMGEIRKIAGDKPVRYVFNTSWYPDHTGGNATLSEGTKIPVSQRAAIIAHENTLAKLTEIGKIGDYLPTDTFFGVSKQVRFNDEPVDIVYAPNAHTTGDVLVHFRKSDVLCVGDIIDTYSYPVIKPVEGGSINGVIDALNHILDITIPGPREEGGTSVIPGHGHLYNEADVADYRDMLVVIRDRILNAITNGKSLEQVKADRLTRDYDAYYGSITGNWTTEMFVTAVYNSLKK